MWIKNRLDLNDVWKLSQKGERVTLWSMGVAAEANMPADGQKRKHENKYSRFQIKIWAEALDSRQYSDLDTPPGYAMFGQEKDKTKLLGMEM